MDTYLELRWSVSRGRETYGYNIVRLEDTTTGKRYRALGGGYDMTGTVFGEWLQDVYQDRLSAPEIARRADTLVISVGQWERNERADSLYGMRRNADGSVVLDGGCGLESMRRIAEALGLKTRALVTRRGSVSGFIVSDTRAV